jgi:hypothetical protein
MINAEMEDLLKGISKTIGGDKSWVRIKQ